MVDEDSDCFFRFTGNLHKLTGYLHHPHVGFTVHWYTLLVNKKGVYQ